MDIQALYTYLRPNLDRVEARIDTSLRSDIALLDGINRRLREHPGKMLRPMLALLVAGACGGVTEDTLRFAAAAELLHNATLLHDDVVDGAVERRGVPTADKLLGGGPAVLVGDYWLVNCMQEVLDASHEPERVLRIFARTLHHLTEGELLQMEKAGKGDTSQADYLRIIYGKTASLFEATATAAAISARASEEQVKAMGQFARLLGTAFQIKDDILDYSESSAALGKPVGLDLKEQKITQPLLCALEGVAADEAAQWRAAVAQVTEHPENIGRLVGFVHAQDGVAKAGAVMDGFIADAIRCLDVLPETTSRQYLEALAQFVGDRKA